jgi:hypothetical protein
MSYPFSLPGSITPVPKGIAEDKLKIWSGQGATTTAQTTHERIRAVIDGIEWRGNRPNVYLQGSYRNSTNIRGDSDVDVVVELTPSRPLLYTYADEINWFINYKTLVTNALQRAFAGVRSGDKCIKIPRTSYTIPADVVPAFQYFKPSAELSLLFPSTTGMKFYVQRENRWVVNYPKQHYDNGAAKNARTADLYKPTVRMFKNALSWIGLDFPGYFIECLLYNVPDDKFRAGMSARQLLLGPSTNETPLRIRYQTIVNWLTSSPLSYFTCQNGESVLFGNSPEQWHENAARHVIKVWSAIWDSYQ